MNERPAKASATKRPVALPAGAALWLAAMVALASGAWASQAELTVDSDLVIPMADMTSTAVFYPVQIDRNLAEFFAVRAPDNSVRVVVNACQSCGPAGYDQNRDYFVCRSCGQRFHVSNLERQKGGCNPIPVGEQNKKIEGGNVVLVKDFLRKVTTSRFAKRRG